MWNNQGVTIKYLYIGLDKTELISNMVFQHPFNRDFAVKHEDFHSLHMNHHLSQMWSDWFGTT